MSSGTKFAIVGGGKMGEGILAGLIRSSQGSAAQLDAGSFTVVEPSEQRRQYLTQTYGVRCVESAGQLGQSDVVLLSVKPQVMMSVLETIRTNDAFAVPNASRPLFITIAAGLTTAKLEASLPEGSALVRVMPNMPLSIGEGASGVCPGSLANEEHVAYVADLFSCLGVSVVVDESLMDVVCALSGSGPAYVAAMVESLRDAAVKQGLPVDLAEKLALQTVLGTAQLLSQSEASIAEIRESICSPGGTTIAALDAMHAEGFDNVFEAGVDAAVKRSKELAQCS